MKYPLENKDTYPFGEMCTFTCEMVKHEIAELI